MARIDFREFIKDTPKTNFYWLVNFEHYKMWLAKKTKNKKKEKGKTCTFMMFERLLVWIRKSEDALWLISRLWGQ